MSEELPDGWAWTTLGNLALSLRNGIFVSRPSAEPSGTPILRIGSVRPLRLDLEEVRYTGLNASADVIRDSLLRPGDLLFTRYNGNPDFVGACAVVPRGIADLTYPDKLIRVVIDERLALPEFVAFACSAGVTRKAIRSCVKTTAGQAGISGRELRAAPIPLPPLAEQLRIVEALEGYLSRLEAGSRAIAINSQRLTRLRTHLMSEVTSQPHTSMIQTSLGAIAHRIRNGIFASRPSSEPIGVPILRIGAVRAMSLDLTDLRYTGISAESSEISHALLNPGDLLFTRYNGNPEYVGACAVVPQGIGPLTYPDKLIRIEINPALANAEYVALASSSGISRRHIRQSVKTTAGQAGISGRELREVPLELPDLIEQEKRVARFDEANRGLGRLATSLASAHQRAGLLRRALLVQAFSGKLVPQDPADEPASELLARIVAERASLGNAKTKPTRKTPATPRSRTTTPPPNTSIVPTGIQEELPL